MRIASNGLRLEVEDHGPADGEPLLLVMGLGMQLVGWPDGFVEGLVRRGFRVVRFDNRDIGLSQGFDAAGVPNLALASLRFTLGLAVSAPYTLADMADDAVGILDALGIASAHVCGASMGGMIAQRMAAAHPARVKSLTLVMTSSGARRLPGPSLKMRSALISRPADPRDRAAVLEHAMRLYGLVASPRYPQAEAEVRARLGAAIARAYRPAGTARQMVAIAADGDRTPLLRRLALPVHVLHGLADPLVPVAAGRQLATTIPEATLDLVDGMGHDLPPGLWSRIGDGIADAARRAGARVVR